MEKSFLEKNLEAFRLRYPHQYENLEKAAQSYEASTFSFSGGTYFREGSPIDTSSPQALQMTIPSEKPIRLALILGFGLGCAFDRLKAIQPATLEEIVLVEPDFFTIIHAFHLRDWTEVITNKTVHWIVGRDYDGCFSEFYNFLAPLARAARMNADYVYTHPLQDALFRDYYFEVRDEWQAAKNLVRLDYGDREDSLLGLRFVFENLPLIQEYPGVQELKDRFAGRPALVVATGPSLLKSLPLLKKLQKRALIISADASYKILIENGITPHIVTSIERHDLSQRFFEAEKNLGEVKTHFVSYPLVPKQVWAAHSGPKWMAFRDYGYFYLLNNSFKKGIISSSGSVAHFGVRLANFLGCEKIVLVGQDLAINQETYATHPEGVAYEEWSRPRTFEELEQELEHLNLGKMLWVPGNKDSLVATTTVYYCFLKQFSWEALRLPNQLFNATDGGAKIPNVPHRELEDFASEWSTEFDAFEVLEAAHHRPVPVEFHTAPFKEYLTQMAAKLAQLAELGMTFKMSGNPQQLGAAIQALAQAREGLQKDPRFMMFVLNSIGRDFLEIEMEWYEALGETTEQQRHQMDILCRWLLLAQKMTADLVEIVPDEAAHPEWGGASKNLSDQPNLPIS